MDNAILTNPNVPREWLQGALSFLPDDALFHIALAAFETDSKRGDFFRSFGVERLPKNSGVCVLAAEMLLAQHSPALAIVAVDKALLADPRDAAAQRLQIKILDAMPQ